VNIARVLQQTAQEHGSSPALIDVRSGRDRTLSFEELERAAAEMAGQLAAHGIVQGDGVLVLHRMSIELYVLLMALFRLGAVPVFLDPSAGTQHIAQCSALFPIRGFFGGVKAHALRLAVPALRRIPKAFCPDWLPGVLRLGSRGMRAQPAAIVPQEPFAPALMTFTSGTTGQPKAALRTHGFLLAQHQALASSIGLRPGVLDLTTLPIFVLANLASGVTSVLPDTDLRRPGAIDAQPVLAQIDRHRITTIGASPALVARLVAECSRTSKQLGGLEHVYMGGAPVFPRDLRQAHEAFPNAEITAVYGSTEAEPMAEVSLSAIASEDFFSMEHGRGLLAGVPVSCVGLRILRDQWGVPIAPLDDAQFQQLCLRTDEVGEIVVAGDHVLPGYLQGVGDAETKFDVDGKRWHRTGDLGRIDGQGRLWLLGRASAKLTDHRGVLYPFAVECAAQQIAGVRRAALLQLGNQRVLAVEGVPASMQNTIREALSWAQLDRVSVLQSIPVDKRHNAKVDYTALRGLLTKGR
jgi:acyl-CoA synthetase (AMP-forming)/AMP-acid ligase II